MKNIYFILLFLFTSHFLLNAQTTVVLSASQDNTIYSDNLNNSNGAGVNFTTGAIAFGPVRRALLRFDLSLIPPGVTITAVTLNMTMNKTVGLAIDVSLHRLNEGWGEGSSNAGAGADGMGAPGQPGDATWVCRVLDGVGGCPTPWTTDGGVFQATASATTSVGDPSSYAWSSSSMRDDVQDWLDNTVPNFGWIIIGDEAAAGSAKRFSSRTNATLAERPTLSVTYNTVVPITLRYFKAQAQNSGSRLSWETAQEINNDFFEIEFSTDGISYTAVGKVKGAGHTSLPKSYNFMHLTNYTGKAFYRLSQTDFNGRKTYSQVELIDLKHTSTSLIISPNPAFDKLVIPGFVIDGKQRYLITALSGERIVEAVLLKQEIILPNKISPGMYMLKITSSDGSVQSGSFIKY